MARKVIHTSILQVDAHSISVLRFQSSGATPKDTVFLRVTGDYADPEQQAQALRAFVEENGLDADVIYTVLPRYDITTRIITLPSHDPVEIAGMVQFSAEEYVPYTADEVVIDQCVLRKLETGESETLIAIAHKDVVENHLSVLREAGVVPEKILLSTACNYVAALAPHPEEPSRYALVSLTAGGIEITVIDNGNPVFTRGIATTQAWEKIAAEPDAPGESMVDMGGAEELAAELRGSLSAYQRESSDGTGVETIYVACAYAHVDALCKSLSSKTGMDCKAAAFVLDALDTPDVALPGLPVEAVGGLIEARGRADIQINLLPEKEVEARRLANVKRIAVHAAIGAAAVILALGGLYAQALYQRAAFINELEQRVAAIEPQVQGITEKRQQLNILRRQVDRQGSVIEQLARLVQAAPDGRLNFSRLSLRRGDGIDIWGRAKTVIDVAEFTTNVRDLADVHLNFFRQARSLYETQTEEREQNVWSYQVEVPMLEDDNDS